MLFLLKNYLINRRVAKRFPSTKIHPTVFIDRTAFQRGDIELGKNSELLNDVQLVGKVTIGEYSYLNTRVIVFSCREHPVTIGKFCSIGCNVSLVSANSHNMKELTTSPWRERIFGEKSKEIGAPITIGHDVWIGTGAIILPGVTIGTGAVVGAGSIVTSGTEIKPYEVWAGNPAKKIKDRFSEETKERLLASQWWERSVEELKGNREFFEKPEL